jgi:hydrophobic/amphiphilic exporter-1 (mainly G- bacteria), HAE1 family
MAIAGGETHFNGANECTIRCWCLICRSLIRVRAGIAPCGHSRFGKEEYEKGKPLLDAALEGARLRLRPILMTSFAFIFGCLPLWFASGSGAVARRILGSTVIGGMIAASGIAIFLIPVTFYVIERLFAGHEQKQEAQPKTEPAV